MSTAVSRPPVLRRIPWYRQSMNRHRPQTKFITQAAMKGVLMSTNPSKKEEENSHELHKPPSCVPEIKVSSPSDLRFNKIQPSEGECESRFRRDSVHYIAREAILDEEFWTAAWLRAESNWEDQPYMRYVDSYKRKFAEQEFTALKRRCSLKHADKCTCIVAVKKEEKNIKRTVLSSIVGTLDVSIRHLLQGETFPGEHVRAPVFSSIYQMDQPKYSYVANLCVAKYARRQGIASNMLYLAVEAARSFGVDQMFVHVHKDNIPAQQLYEKIGFKMVPRAMPLSLEEERYLLHFSP